MLLALTLLPLSFVIGTIVAVHAALNDLAFLWTFALWAVVSMFPALAGWSIALVRGIVQQLHGEAPWWRQPSWKSRHDVHFVPFGFALLMAIPAILAGIGYGIYAGIVTGSFLFGLAAFVALVLSPWLGNVSSLLAFRLTQVLCGGNVAFRIREGQRWRFRQELNEFEDTLFIGKVDRSKYPTQCKVFIRFKVKYKSKHSLGVDGVILNVANFGLRRDITELVEKDAKPPDWSRYRKDTLIGPDGSWGGFFDSLEEGLRVSLGLEGFAAQGGASQTAAIPRDQVLNRMDPWKQANRRDAWRPIVEQGDGPLSASKYSGLPWLAADEQWPTCPDCTRPLQLFLQLDLANIPRGLKQKFGRGLLQLFYCVHTGEGVEGEPACKATRRSSAPFGGGKVVRIVHPKPALRLLRSSRGASLPVNPIREGYFPAQTIIGWEKVVDYPDAESHAELGVRYAYDSSGTALVKCAPLYLEFAHQEAYIADAISTALGGDKLAGWPYRIQGGESPRCPQCNRQMAYVFQVDSVDNLPFMFGEMGCGHITQCPEHKDVVTFAWDSP